MDSLQITLNPQLPWLALLGLSVAAILVTALGWFQRAGGVGWHLGCFGVIMLALLEPSLVAEKRQRQSDVAVVLVDRSPSQQLGDRAARIEQALQHFGQQLDTLDHLEVRQIDVSGHMTATRLFTPLREQLAGIPPKRRAGVILISDGQIHDLPSQLVPGQFGPVHVMLTGERNEFDRRLQVTQAPSYGTVNQSVTVELKVIEQPQDTEQPARVTVRQPERPTYTVEVGNSISLDMPLAHGGINFLQASLEPLPEEVDLANNQVAVMVNALRVPLRVLLLSGRPHAGGRVWRALLKSDPNVELVHVTILRESTQGGVPESELSLIRFPVDELFNKHLHSFDLIILDRYLARGYISYPYLDRIVRYVENGGALLESGYLDRGDVQAGIYRATIGQILPGRSTDQVLEQGFIPAISERGKRHPVMDGLAQAHSATTGQPQWGRWFRQSVVEVQRGEIIMTGAQGQPLLLLARVKNGRVAQLTSNQIWLWQRGFEGGGPTSQLLRRLIHWLMKEPELEENGLSANFQGEQLIIERRFLDSPPALVRLTTPSGEKHNLSLVEQQDGLVRALWQASEIGLYQVEDGDKTAVALLDRSANAEFSNLLTTDQIIKPVVELSGGGIFWLADSAPLPRVRRMRFQQIQHGSDWIGLRKSNSFEVVGRSNTALIPDVVLLGLGLGLLLIGWHRGAQLPRASSRG